MWKPLIVSMAIAASFGCATTRQEEKDRTAGEFIDDATLTANVNAAIISDDDARFFKINVSTVKGDVMLQGSVNSHETESRLIARVRQMRGVRSVNSSLRIEAP